MIGYVLHLQEFLTKEGGGEAPLEGSIPDMTSSTELVTVSQWYDAIFVLSLLKKLVIKNKKKQFTDIRWTTICCRHYVNLQNIYLSKADADFLAIEQRVRNILRKIGRDPNSISKAIIKGFCKNARKLKVSE